MVDQGQTTTELPKIPTFTNLGRRGNGSMSTSRRHFTPPGTQSLTIALAGTGGLLNSAKFGWRVVIQRRCAIVPHRHDRSHQAIDMAQWCRVTRTNKWRISECKMRAMGNEGQPFDNLHGGHGWTMMISADMSGPSSRAAFTMVDRNDHHQAITMAQQAHATQDGRSRQQARPAARQAGSRQ